MKHIKQVFSSQLSISGFTLIELLIVVVILAILSVIGLVVFTGLQGNARDAKRREDIQAIAKAYEANYNLTTFNYAVLTDVDFSNEFPEDPRGAPYTGLLNAPAAFFRVCAALEDHNSETCNSSSATCFCKSSQRSDQVVALPSSTPIPSLPPVVNCPTGVTGYWKLDEVSGTIAADSSGNGNNGTATDLILTNADSNTPPAAVGGIINNARDFDGVDDAVIVPHSSSLDFAGKNQLTITAWVKRQGTTPESNWRIISKGLSWSLRVWEAPTLQYNFYAHRAGDQDPVFQQYFFGNSAENEEAFVAVVLNGTNLTAYTGSAGDLVLNKSTTIDTNFTTFFPSTETLQIGNYTNASRRVFPGLIDDVRLYTRALSEIEVNDIYQGCTSP